MLGTAGGIYLPEPDSAGIIVVVDRMLVYADVLGDTYRLYGYLNRGNGISRFGIGDDFIRSRSLSSRANAISESLAPHRNLCCSTLTPATEPVCCIG